MQLKLRRWLLCFCFLFVLTGCTPSGPVTCNSKLDERELTQRVQLSDGELIFLPEPLYYNGVVANAAGEALYNPILSRVIPEAACPEFGPYTYEEITAYLECDVVQVLKEAGVAESCIPTKEELCTYGAMLTQDATVKLTCGEERKEFDLKAGHMWGGEVYCINERPEGEETVRSFYLCANVSGQFVAPQIDPVVWVREPNSRVGDIPVYIHYYHRVPDVGVPELDEFFAWFEVDGYTYAILARNYAQQDFVHVLLAIINYYGAYPSRDGK